VRHGQMTKDYGAIFENYGAQSIVITPDKKYLFATNDVGHLKQISLESREVICDYKKIHDNRINCLETTKDSKSLITGSYDKHVKRISVKNREVEKEFG
jgi:WD40 repeat protein